jgi:hypothetical protein
LIQETPLASHVDRDSLTNALIRLSWFAADCADLVTECDLNPVRCAGAGLQALDALIVLRGEA